LYSLTNPEFVWNCGGFISAKKQNTITSEFTLKEDFKIYPNPTTNKTFIELPSKSAYEINLMDISGNIIKQLETELEATTCELNVSDIPKGMYLVELKNELSSHIQKLVIE